MTENNDFRFFLVPRLFKRASKVLILAAKAIAVVTISHFAQIGFFHLIHRKGVSHE